MVKVRRVLYTSEGYLEGKYLGSFPDDIETVYDEFSQLWMEENSNSKDELNDNVSEKDVEYVDEFTFCDDDSFCIGVRDGYMFEGITEDYVPYPGAVIDEYGFEQMRNAKGEKINYSKLFEPHK